MANVTLTDLIAKVRQLAARPSPNQISDNEIINYINLFYEFDFPQQLKMFDFRTNFSFVTQPNQDIYPLASFSGDVLNVYKSFEPPVYAAGFAMLYYQSQDLFYRNWPKLATSTNLSTGDGTTGAYTGTLNSTPALKGSVLISVVGPAGNALVAQDNGTTGTLTGDVTAGSVNYTTGAVTVTWNAAIPSGNTITAQWVAYQSSRPLSMLFFDNKFVLRPVPDQAYSIEIQAFLTPTAYIASNPGATPFLNEYFQVLAYGATCKIFVDSLEMDNFAAIRPLYMEQLALCERKSIMQIKTQRAYTIYSDNMGWSANRLPTS